MTLSRKRYIETVSMYWETIDKLPVPMQRMFPAFNTFVNNAVFLEREWMELTPAGTRLYELLHSPHAATLLAIYAHRHLTPMETTS